MSTAPIYLFGPGSFVAAPLFAMLKTTGREIVAVSRRQRTIPDGVTLYRCDPWADPDGFAMPEGSTLIALAPLAAMAALGDRLKPAQRIVALGSTSMIARKDAPDAADRAFAAGLAHAEDKLLTLADGARQVTVLRPTLIYDGEHDRNVTALARLIHRFRLIALPGAASGLRQPIHASDVAGYAFAAAIGQTPGGALTITGGETLSYREMVSRIFEALGQRERVLTLPSAPSIMAARLVKRLTGRGPGAGLVHRINQDLAFDDTQARRLFNVMPRRFHPDFSSWA